MYGLTRGTMTLIGVAAAGFLLWLAAQFEAQGNGEYWAQMGIIAAAGLVMALSQLLGGWTKWGWPRLSAGVFLLGFLPALVVGGLVLLHMQPGDALGSGWAGDLGFSGLADDLGGLVPVIAFGLGLTFGFTFDTTGPRIDDDEVVEEHHRTVEHVPADRRAADEPVTAERDHVVATSHRDEDVVHHDAGAHDGEARRQGLIER